MILSRVLKPADNTGDKSKISKTKNAIPDLEHFISRRDYTGILTLLEFNHNASSNVSNVWVMLWKAFSYFHLGNYKKALDIYKQIADLKYQTQDIDIHINIAICYFYLGSYNESQEYAVKSKDMPVKNRLLFHLAHKLSDEANLMDHHQKLKDVPQDQLCLASIHYLRAHYQEAIDIYKKLLLENRDLLALNVYVALCYYKLDYYDVSQEVLSVYLNQYPQSIIAINLKACNIFRLYNGKLAENELKQITTDQDSFGNDLVKHNLVVFRSGEGALKVLPGLVDLVGEARLNLVARCLKDGEAQEALDLLKGLQPSIPLQYILKGVVHASLGQKLDSEEHVKIAQECFHLVGSSVSECDTIPGRQCMASSYFLYSQFEEVLVYLNSIKSFFINDDIFNFNYGQAKCATGYYKEAEEALLAIQDEKIKSSFAYNSCLCRSYIMNNNGKMAWELCQKMSAASYHFELLQIVGNDCYRMGDFLIAARAFHLLDRLDPNPEYWEGMRGACVGVIQLVVAKSAEHVQIKHIINLLQNTQHSQATSMARIISNWATDMDYY